MAAGYPSPIAAAVPSTRVELHLSCDKLADTDVFSKSDPFVVLFTRGGAEWREVGGIIIESANK